jgi:hypothetical protein
MKHSEQIDKLAKALALAQAELESPAIDSTADTGKFKYRYASLSSVRNAVIPVLLRHGLAVLQSPGTSERGPTLTTLLMHESGQWLESDPLMIPVAALTAQGYGSALTYARRYSLQAIAGVVAEEDDDAGAAVHAPPQKAANAPARPRQASKALPQSGQELYDRLKVKEQALIDAGLCRSGELLDHVAAAGMKAGIGSDVAAWTGAALQIAPAAVREFEVSKDAQKITTQEASELALLVNRKGRSWKDVLVKLGLSARTQPADLTRGQLRAATLACNEMPDVRA